VTPLVLVALALAALPALLYLRNARLFRPPPVSDNALSPPRVSVLIPARDEERSVGAAVQSVLASVGVELEVIVLDDHSEDATAEIVRKFAAADSRVRLEQAPPLPAGWCGKQFACYTLSRHARYPLLTFLDADVRLAPDALARMVAFLHASGADLVSGFPRQETGTLLEKLVIPLINWLVMCYLPIGSMRRSRQPGLGTGCGQWFLTTREAYDATGGHSAVKASLHDGIKLPRAYRRAGFRTDICDATDLAVCRMYHSAAQVWYGLAKNAREGLGAQGLIWIWTLLLFGGHVLPVLLLPFIGLMEVWQICCVFGAVILSYLPRLASAVRFRQSLFGAALHPIGILCLLAVQWYATGREWIGRPIGWKGRAHPAQSES
jgi:cellulose synthase/poly-beta-1,6-N-acetylglucosamine synthase-like glycosyltransferase